MGDDQHTDYAAGFMTLREKHWLAGIQTIQFNTNNPLEEDYYFTVNYIMKKKYSKHDKLGLILLYFYDNIIANNFKYQNYKIYHNYYYHKFY